MSQKHIGHILVATDGAPAAREAVELAKANDATVTFLHVVPPVAFRGIRRAAAHAVPTLLPHVGDEPLDHAVALASDQGVRFERRLIEGDPAEVIVALADAIDADLIVVGERSKRPKLGGSFSSVVVRRASRPVLVARRRTADRVAA